jgi:hypothetical protein
MIESLEEAERSLLRERAGKARRDFRRAVRPIYAVANDGANRRPQHVGSCILLLIDGQRILSTAAHILDDRANALLSVGGLVGTRLVPIVDGMFKATTAPQGDRNRDRLDCGFWLISDDVAAALGSAEFLDAERISHNRAPTEHRYYMAMGYRVSRNKDAIDRRTQSIETRASTYSGSLLGIPEPARRQGFSDAQHLFLQFGDHAEDEDGKQANTFGPRGFSGGALVDLGDFTPAQVYASAQAWRATLSGMLIEHRKEHNAMVAVQIGSIVEGIRNALRSNAA